MHNTLGVGERRTWQWESLTQMPMAEKATKERKKLHKCLWQRKEEAGLVKSTENGAGHWSFAPMRSSPTCFVSCRGKAHNTVRVNRPYLLQILLWNKPHAIFPEVSETALSEVFVTQMCVRRCSSKVSMFNLRKFDPFSPYTSYSRLILREHMHSYALGSLWIVATCCNTVGWHN